MMQWLADLIKNNPFGSLVVPTSISIISFLGHLSIALSDGIIDDNEFHQLMSSANGIEMVILIVIMFFLKNTKVKKD